MGIEAYPVLQRMHDVPLFRESGMTFVDAGEGWAELLFEPAARLNNFYGFVHGGAWLLVADSAMGGALSTIAPRGAQVITTQLDFRWLRKFSGARALARGRAIHHGRTVSHCEVEIAGEDGTAIARGTATYVVTDP